jgi:hypothetical protein
VAGLDQSGVPLPKLRQGLAGWVDSSRHPAPWVSLDHSDKVVASFWFIDARDIHAGIVYLLDHLPPRLDLVIASRTDPPLPLPRPRARGDLVEVRAADLRFTIEGLRLACLGYSLWSERRLPSAQRVRVFRLPQTRPETAHRNRQRFLNENSRIIQLCMCAAIRLRQRVGR